MSVQAGTYAMDDRSGSLLVRTGRAGAIAKVGHDLVLEVGSWGATVEIGTDGSPTLMELNADARSLEVREGSGGVKPLDDDDRANIGQTIKDEVLRNTSIAFRATTIRKNGSGRFDVAGELELFNGINEISFELAIEDDGHVAGSAVVTQTRWGVKPYTTLFGTLKVSDDVNVSIDGRLVVAGDSGPQSR